jgi:tRNA(adenine34) deaminase
VRDNPTVEDLDQRFMRVALDEARRSLSRGDVPVGAAVARGDELLGAAGNQRERLGDPTAHAEILAIRVASERVHGWRLDGCTLFVTLEPCAMCAGAMVLSRLDRLVFGAADPKAGFTGSLGNLVQDPRLNHRVEITSGVGSEEAAALLKEFFASRRGQAAL